MELKNYQKGVMDDLSLYMQAVDENSNLFKAWTSYWAQKDIPIGANGVPKYKNKIPGTPHVCMKVPTGGGKTYMACSSVKRIFDHMPEGKPRVVVWLVPSDSILTQTIRTLSDTTHPYRQRLDMDFAGKVGVYTKDMLLGGQNFSPDTIREMLSVCVLSYASLRIDSKKKDVRKVYQENGYLFRFADFFDDKSALLADTPDTALIQVLRCLSPVTIVDESHNAGSTLSAEMLRNLNPSFILELTATPRSSSNIISYVDARELKKESMVKLPVIVFERSNQQAVLHDAIQLRGSIEKMAAAERENGGPYIRPIVLIQAQPNVGEESETFEKIQKRLVDIGIPGEQIAVKTSKVNDIGDTDLMSENCEIRYIITVNALKEGWDCPFAYILASIANKTSRVDVEQVLGRILRQPYARQHKEPLLNTSYVLTSSADFHAALEGIVVALNQSGFSRKDYRIAENAPVQETLPQMEPEQLSFDTHLRDGEEETLGPQLQDGAEGLLDLHLTDRQEEPLGLHLPDWEEDDSFFDIDPGEIHPSMIASANGSTGLVNADEDGSLAAMVTAAISQAEDYTNEIRNTPDAGYVGGELGEMLRQNAIQQQYRDEVKDLRIPQFYIRCQPDLFGNEFELLEPENLSEGFSLIGQDAQVTFELDTGDMYRIDIQDEGEAVPKYKKAAKDESRYVRQFMESLPPEGRVRQCIKMIASQINKNDRYASSEVEDYVKRCIAALTDDELAMMETAIPVYAQKIQKKIASLEKKYRAEQFGNWLDSGKVVCMESYELPQVITPAKAQDAIPYSLYEAEKDDMNAFERQVLDAVIGTDNIRWWHRIIERKDFRLNGYFNHYPDFMVMTKSGKLVLIEVKGDYLDGDDSREKLELGRRWHEQTENQYQYFMVFKDKEIGLPRAYTFDKFIRLMREI